MSAIPSKTHFIELHLLKERDVSVSLQLVGDTINPLSFGIAGEKDGNTVAFATRLELWVMSAIHFIHLAIVDNLVVSYW